MALSDEACRILGVDLGTIDMTEFRIADMRWRTESVRRARGASPASRPLPDFVYSREAAELSGVKADTVILDEAVGADLTLSQVTQPDGFVTWQPEGSAPEAKRAFAGVKADVAGYRTLFGFGPLGVLASGGRRCGKFVELQRMEFQRSWRAAEKPQNGRPLRFLLAPEPEPAPPSPQSLAFQRALHFADMRDEPTFGAARFLTPPS